MIWGHTVGRALRRVLEDTHGFARLEDTHGFVRPVRRCSVDLSPGLK
jgi:hypothetical protein